MIVFSAVATRSSHSRFSSSSSSWRVRAAHQRSFSPPCALTAKLHTRQARPRTRSSPASDSWSWCRSCGAPCEKVTRAQGTCQQAAHLLVLLDQRVADGGEGDQLLPQRIGCLHSCFRRLAAAYSVRHPAASVARSCQETCRSPLPMDVPAVECLREAMKSVNAMTLALALLTLPAPHDPAQQRTDESWAG